VEGFGSEEPLLVSIETVISIWMILNLAEDVEGEFGGAQIVDVLNQEEGRQFLVKVRVGNYGDTAEIETELWMPCTKRYSATHPLRLTYGKFAGGWLGR
jgi:hypothetical protein